MNWGQKNIKKIRLAFLFGIICLMASIGCTTQQRIYQAEETEIINIRQSKKSEKIQKIGEGKKASPKVVTFVDKDGKEKIVVESERDSVTGEYIKTMELEEVSIVAKAKTLPERNGEINIDFIVNIPNDFIQRDWRLVIIPNILNGEDKMILDSLQIKGFAQSHFEQREYNARERMQAYNKKTLEAIIYREKDSIKKEQYIDLYKQKIGTERQEEKMSCRLDTIMHGDEKFNFYYKQTLKTSELNTRLKLFFEAYVVNVAGEKYSLAKGDTLTFIISSMMQFLDREPRYKRIITKRKVTQSLNADVMFYEGSGEVIDSLGNNFQELNKISAKIKEISEGNEFIVDSIAIYAYCSPEGNKYDNRRLAKERGESLKKYFLPILDEEAKNVITVTPEGEDWNTVRKEILQSAFINNKVEILQIIDEVINEDEREKAIKNNYPQDYKLILENIYPHAKNTTFKFYLARRNMVEDIAYTDVIDTAYAEAIKLMDRRRYKEAMPKLLEYTDWNTAICFMSLGYNEKAEKILKTQEVNADREYLLAILAARMGIVEEAVRLYLKSCEMDASKVMRGELDPEIAELIRIYNLEEELINM